VALLLQNELDLNNLEIVQNCNQYAETAADSEVTDPNATFGEWLAAYDWYRKACIRSNAEGA
jgi:hypothetical protein